MRNELPKRTIPFKEIVLPVKPVPLGLQEPTAIVPAVQALSVLRKYAAENPDDPYGPCHLDDLALDDDGDRATTAITTLWAAGLVRLFAGVDPATGNVVGMVCPATKGRNATEGTEDAN